jgi:uncharacterized membrane protein
MQNNQMKWSLAYIPFDISVLLWVREVDAVNSKDFITFLP